MDHPKCNEENDIQNKKNPFKIIVVCIIAAIVIAMPILGGIKSLRSNFNINAKKVYIKEDEIKAVYSSPNDFKGNYMRMTGRIFEEPEPVGNMLCVQMWNDFPGSNYNTIVSI